MVLDQPAPRPVPSQSPPPNVDALLAQLWSDSGTDLLITAGTTPLLRVDGELRPAHDAPILDETDTARLLTELLSEEQQNELAQHREYDFSFTWRSQARVRGNAFYQRNMPAVALRIIPRAIPAFDELGLPQAARQFAALRQGLVLVTGPTGSGKSTTLAALIDWINTHRAVHVITIEDPIEYVHDHKRSAVNQREVGNDTTSFPSALRSVLRGDPDVLLVGEMRDLESIQFALTIAETGHLVFATLHTNDTAQTLDRLVDVFPAERQAQIRVQLANCLTGIVYQRLVPRLGGGQVAAYEVLVANSASRNLVREGKTNQLRNVLVTGQRDGCQTLEMSLSALVHAGWISYEDALERSLYPKSIEAGPAGPNGSPRPSASARWA